MASNPPVYLDYCASAPLKRGVWEAMQSVALQPGNASSVHGFGRARRQQVDMARESIARHFGVKASQVIFTSGATESNNTLIQAFPGRPVVVSSIEHPSVLAAAPNAVQLRVDRDGIVDLNHLESVLQVSPQPPLVCLMAVNNETGVVQPISEAAALCKTHGALLHSDAVAATGRLSFTFDELGADSISLCAHKLGGPQGVGALIVREGLEIQPLMTGGGQEMRRRAGTENVMAIVGFAEALKLSDQDLEQVSVWLSWRNAFEAAIMREVPEAVIFGQSAQRVCNIVCLAMPEVSNETQLMAFDLAGFAVSAGSACSSGKVQPSPVLKAMGAGNLLAQQAIRMSFGWNTTPDQLDAFSQTWIEFYRRPRQLRVSAA
jgi:cysteine desulfurase